ncbi:hypothetical protein V6N12_032315 [Hibiscus sabdariffa]|uniref:Uncharacterized protein n=1 Tax=Hibiscus sabdariffa TaxID=183260 RepID=A0ABR2CE64_9ROSI
MWGLEMDHQQHPIPKSYNLIAFISLKRQPTLLENQVASQCGGGDEWSLVRQSLASNGSVPLKQTTMFIYKAESIVDAHHSVTRAVFPIVVGASKQVDESVVDEADQLNNVGSDNFQTGGGDLNMNGDMMNVWNEDGATVSEPEKSNEVTESTPPREEQPELLGNVGDVHSQHEVSSMPIIQPLKELVDVQSQHV